ncbi:hypothetical protein N656DRAFT_765691 [Canariomyces notabilis]|uniref:Uncharacterized protein n=1 Tax=Canariomyces notabilis TaxID=2074819 RepID=A0AAN6TLU4_9PEZI|nr:hypothetical protein N656DRAFT_765691 [Canariomyces arenarius]
MLAILPLSIELSDSSGVLRAPHQKDQASNPPLPSSPAWTTGSTTAHSPPITTFSHISYQLLQPNNSRGRRIHLLTLPLEVRLLIYHHLLSLTPMWPRDLSGPSHPLPHHGSGQPQHDGTTYLLLRPRLPGLHPPYPHDPHAVPSAAGYLPSSLLCTNRQIYNEARLVPFHHNEFAFVSWFFSGLSAARAFVARLAGWQRDGLRFARLEKVLAADLVEEGRVRMWEELCGFWENGLQRLRLKIELGPVKMEQEVWNRDEEGLSKERCEVQGLASR